MDFASSLMCPVQLLRLTQPPIHWVSGGSFSGGNAWLGCDADHSLSSSAEVKNDLELYCLSSLSPEWWWQDGFTITLPFILYANMFRHYTLNYCTVNVKGHGTSLENPLLFICL
jgi:hypothetical protein